MSNEFHECIDCGDMFLADKEWMTRCLDCYIDNKEVSERDPQSKKKGIRSVSKIGVKYDVAPTVNLAESQLQAINEVLALSKTYPVVALRGLAGSGKSTCIPHLAAAMGGDPVVAAPTNRAAVVLRKKGLKSAATIHSACLKMDWLPEFREYLDWFKDDGQPLPALLYSIAKPTIKEAMDRHPTWYEESKTSGEDEETEARCAIARELGIDPFMYSDWLPRKKVASSVLIVDEASMVDEVLLAKAAGSFDRVILVGDPGQLSPVNGRSCLAEVPGVSLTEIFRQAEGGGIVTLAHAVREAERFQVRREPGVHSIVKPDASLGPLIVFANKTRLDYVRKFREELGMSATAPVAGEILVCRSESPVFKDVGLVKNSFWIYEGGNTLLSEDGSTRIELEFPPFMEELVPENRQPPRGHCAFRFIYAITAHTAQGSEWPSVQVHAPSFHSQRTWRPDEARRWLYTAITRAREDVYILGSISNPRKRLAA